MRCETHNAAYDGKRQLKRVETAEFNTDQTVASSRGIMKRDHLERRAPRKDRKMEVTIRIPDNLAAEARAHGVSVEVYVQEILARQAIDSSGEQRVQSVRTAIDRILELRKGNKLAGLRTKDLIHSAGIKTIW
jgi:hypothetical protein